MLNTAVSSSLPSTEMLEMGGLEEPELIGCWPGAGPALGGGGSTEPASCTTTVPVMMSAWMAHT